MLIALPHTPQLAARGSLPLPKNPTLALVPAGLEVSFASVEIILATALFDRTSPYVSALT